MQRNRLLLGSLTLSLRGGRRRMDWVSVPIEIWEAFGGYFQETMMLKYPSKYPDIVYQNVPGKQMPDRVFGAQIFRLVLLDVAIRVSRGGVMGYGVLRE